jgi:uncharacterized protein YndB with AHSA1/START domain
MPLFITNSIFIAAPEARVWEVLTEPAETKQYMFGCEARSDWQPGSPLLWQGEADGKPMVFVKGTIVEIVPSRKLVYTVFDPNNPAMDDKSENYLTVTYELHEDEDGTLLTVTQGDYSNVADGQRRYEESYNGGEGWNPILEKIKEQSER